MLRWDSERGGRRKPPQARTEEHEHDAETTSLRRVPTVAEAVVEAVAEAQASTGIDGGART